MDAWVPQYPSNTLRWILLGVWISLFLICNLSIALAVLKYNLSYKHPVEKTLLVGILVSLVVFPLFLFTPFV